MTGLELRQKREQLDLTIEQFAEQLGMPDRIDELERWESSPEETACHRCPGLLEVAVASLFHTDLTSGDIDLMCENISRSTGKKLGDILKDFESGVPLSNFSRSASAASSSR